MAIERVEGARTPYEVYCFRCRVTFPVEARRCLHCGGTVYGREQRAPVGPQPAPSLGFPAPAGEGAEDSPLAMARRSGGLVVWALVALAAVLSHLCGRG
jgi:hypothetical protein